MQLDDLPDENISFIFQYLNTSTILLQCSLVSHRWLIIASEVDLHVVIQNNFRKANCFLSLLDDQMLQVKSLSLSKNHLNTKHVEMIICSKYLQNISDLDLSYNNIGTDYLCRRMMKCLGNLRALNLRYSGFGGILIKLDGFSSNSTLSNLTSLDLSYERVEEHGAEYISNNLKKLQILKLRGCFIQDVGVKHICNLEQLTSLDLSFNNIGREGCAFISNGKLMKNLKTLDISNNFLFSHLALPLLFSGENGKNLTSLNMSGLYISMGNELVSLNNLRELNLSKCKSMGCLNRLNSCDLLSKLTILNIDCNMIGNVNLNKLQKCKNLKELNISRNNITCSGAYELSQFDLPNLTTLILDGNDIQYYGILSILNSKTLPNPKQLLSKNKSAVIQGLLATVMKTSLVEDQ
ncbi:hypothetical protein NAEGRDRAFT_74454 [Naegleria gruberi]|uniref:F-box domain-containing protein n=1 Tax=Naegleria gruberi TaxID=5762 RepID=D2VZD9_NAEGR|nr:uncharacterized protein NAEGRDRAFT_74454 [Naegleria gruberi]EFC37775.1 hypothetical protein NAEGRDRAFT_74454 [Naegleria gruberi]|eukprot:XP_002670519.1 hypothetical protein NAEGRDRAFT_74454 [Naegleria gruberi strain NEG-M]